MSLFRSILQGRPLQRADYNALPLYSMHQEPEQFPPAPIAGSLLVTSAPRPKAAAASEPSPRSKDLLLLQRRSRLCISRLQEYVTAQSEGLSAGAGAGAGADGEVHDEEGSIDTPTQTSYSLRSSSASPSREPASRKIGLRQARKAIWKTLRECAAVKAEEDFLLGREVRQSAAVARQLEQWSARENGLSGKIALMEGEGEGSGARMESLKSEARTLEAEMSELEVRLAQLRTRHRAVVNQLEEHENTLQSRLSSYRTSLGMLRRDVQEFLRAPPVGEHLSQASKESSTFVSLPASRRTLDMAREHWATELSTLKAQRKRTQRDRVALEEGAGLWKLAVEEIADYERFLRRQIALSASPIPAGHGGKGKSRAGESPPAKATPDEMAERLDLLLRSIDEKLALAHERGWQLLTVCLDAELQALETGRRLLEQTLGIPPAAARALGNGVSVGDADADRDAEEEEEEEEEEPHPDGPSTQGSSTRDLFASAAEGLSGSGLASVTQSAALRRGLHKHGSEHGRGHGRDEDEDEDPDPELLFSRPQEDTE